MNRQFTVIRALSALVVGAAALGNTVAHADTFDNDLFYRPSTTSQVSRAEVQADLKIYQESGLAAVERLDSELGHDSQRLLAARERYAQLRSNGRYAALVQQYAQRDNVQTRQQRGA